MPLLASQIPQSTASRRVFIQVWRNPNWQNRTSAITSQGYHVILSAPWYLNKISYGEDWLVYFTTDPHNFTGATCEETLRQRDR